MMDTIDSASHLIDAEPMDPESLQSDADMTGDDEVDEDVKLDRTEATFAHIDPSRAMNADEKEKWKRSGHKPGNYICPECGKGLSRIDSLTRHRRSRHRVGRQYFCRLPGCRRQTSGFGRFDNYRRHLESTHGITVEPNDAEERQLASRGAPTEAMSVQPEVASMTVSRSMEVEKRGSYICIPLPSLSRSAAEKLAVKTPKASAKPAGIIEKSIATAVSPATFSSLRPVVEDVQSLTNDELIRRLRSKIRECEDLQQRNRVLEMERDEYMEALRISEELRGVQSFLP